MRTITSTELARNWRQVIDELISEGGEIIVERNQRVVAHIVAGPRLQTALEAMADLYRTLPDTVADGWERDCRGLGGRIR